MSSGTVSRADAGDDTTRRGEAERGRPELPRRTPFSGGVFMKIKEAIASARKLSGNAVDDAALCRWLSELDGRLMLDFYKGSEWMSYSLPQDEDHELLVPFPWDELYVHYLEAMVYYSNGEFDRYRNSYEMFNKKELDYRQWYARNQLPTTLEALERRDCTVVTEGRGSRPFWYLSAYALAVKHGYQGTEAEWLEDIRGERVQLRYNEDTDALDWKYEDGGAWAELMGIDAIRGPVVDGTLEQATAAKEAAESAKTAAEAARDSAGTASEAAVSAKETAVSAKNGAEAAAGNASDSAGEAAASAELAGQKAAAAEKSAEAAAASAASIGQAEENAAASATEAESWAVGGTGTREGEDTNNAKYWSARAQDAAGGGVTSFNNRTGAVRPVKGDYTADLVTFTDGDTFQDKFDAGKLTGPAGPQGTPGSNGKDGADGAPGPAGADGEPGPAGADGGYYQPAVDGSGNLTWTASKAGMPSVAGANIRGPQGPQGVQAPVINDLTTGGVSDALSAEMGKRLQSIKADLTLSNLSNKQKALRNIGGRPNRNLLDNWYFVGGGSQQGGGQFPINQRAETSHAGSGGFIDRWKLSGEGTATLGSDGITLTATTGNLEFMQFLGIPNDRLLGETVCLSGLVDGDLLSMSTSAPEEKPSAWTNIINIIKPFGFVQFNYDNTADRFFCNVIVSAGNSVRLQASKLELGSTQTLAYQDEKSNWKLFETPDYAGELAECQRYFVQFRSEEQRFIGIVHLDSDNYGQGVIWTPVQMRAIPTVSGAVSFYGGGNNGLVASVAPLGVGATAVRVNITLQDAVSTNSIVFLHSNDIQGGPVTLSAEL